MLFIHRRTNAERQTPFSLLWQLSTIQPTLWATAGVKHPFIPLSVLLWMGEAPSTTFQTPEISLVLSLFRILPWVPRCTQLQPLNPDTVCKLKGLLEQLPLNKRPSSMYSLQGATGLGGDKGSVNRGSDVKLETKWTGKGSVQLLLLMYHSITCLGGNE